MSLGITWYSLAEAEGKSCVKQEEILQWIDDGLIRIMMETIRKFGSTSMT
jgi:hypothetical protein